MGTQIKQMNSFPKRKSIRLKHHDYSSAGWYYVTICTKNQECAFGHITAPVVVVGATRGSPAMMPNQYGAIVENVWKSLPDHHPVELDAFQLMPNHVHFIIVLTGGSRPTPTELGTIVGLFKSECTKQIRRVSGNPHFIVWQRNYYENIIRTEEDLNKIKKYIRNNPQTWNRDRNNPINWKQ